MHGYEIVKLKSPLIHFFHLPRVCVTVLYMYIYTWLYILHLIKINASSYSESGTVKIAKRLYIFVHDIVPLYLC